MHRGKAEDIIAPVTLHAALARYLASLPAGAEPRPPARGNRTQGGEAQPAAPGFASLDFLASGPVALGRRSA